jgi:CO/xanthine dehydrogenase FAD-binding subunit
VHPELVEGGADLIAEAEKGKRGGALTQMVQIQPDGLHLLAEATLAQLAADETLADFADGLLPKALSEAGSGQLPGLPLAEALHLLEPAPIRSLLTVLMALDAEVRLTVEDKVRILPLPGFLSYRDRLPLNNFPLDIVRLPPLNAGGHYFFSKIEPDRFIVIRLDLHPVERLAGHVRVAVSHPGHLPQRVTSIEQRLERQILTEALLEEVIGDQPLSVEEQTEVIRALKALE